MNRRPLSLSVLLSTAALLSLAGCTQLPSWSLDDVLAEPKAQAPRAEAPAPQRATGQTAQRPAKAPDLKALRPVPRPDGKEVAGADGPLPLKLVGLSEDETAELLGRPTEESAEPPGKIWVYRAAGCRLSVHLFPDMDKGGFYALDYTVTEGVKENCLGKVAGEARKKGSALAGPAKS